MRLKERNEVTDMEVLKICGGNQSHHPLAKKAGDLPILCDTEKLGSDKKLFVTSIYFNSLESAALFGGRALALGRTKRRDGGIDRRFRKR